MKLILVAGARPNFVKISPIIKALNKAKESNKHLEFTLIHTGQHYDDRMSRLFFDQLEIPSPDVNLEVGSGTYAYQVGTIMVKFEQIVEKYSPDFVLVVGDVNSTVACSLAAKTRRIKVAHVEAGLRSHDWDMPEEINRVVVDAITDVYFTTTENASNNLIKAGVAPEKICLVGNVMIDSLIASQDKFTQPQIARNIDLEKKPFVLLTLHRPSNVDEAEKLHETLQVLAMALSEYVIVFPAHPRTKKTLDQRKIDESILVIEPLPYLEFMYLVSHASLVITDSGGIQEETTYLKVPCITLRENTERPETIEIGTNELAKDLTMLKGLVRRFKLGQWKKGKCPELWDGKAAEKIVSKLLEIHELS